MSNITNVTITGLHVGKSVSFDTRQLSITQTFEPNWATENAYGKMDPIATYASTSRKAEVQMMMQAHTVEEAAALQQNIDSLMQMNYPVYGSTGGSTFIKSPPFFQINVLNDKSYKEFRGYFTSFTVTPGSNEGITPLTDQSGFFLQRQFKVDWGMTVLHSGVPGFGSAGLFKDGGGFVYYESKPPEDPGTEGAAIQVATALGLDPKSSYSTVGSAMKKAIGPTTQNPGGEE